MAKKQTASVATDSAVDALTFEQAYGQLEAIVTQLEQGDLALDQLLDLHARGQKLADHCAHQLDQAELKVTQISD